VSRFLLDTNVVSETNVPRPDPRVARWIRGRRAEDLFLSATVVAELASGIAVLPRGQRRRGLQAWLDHLVREAFDGRVLAFDAEAALIFGELVAAGHAMGRPPDIADAQIAAVAASRSLTVATRNLRDFEVFRLRLVDPWAG
jgi:predicted nucleic acid-binding protein